MSIVTKTGDAGTTRLMCGRRVSKSHPRVEAYGCVDELNAALGLARATARHALVRTQLAAVQKDLVILMGELATAPADLPRYVRAGFSRVTPALRARLDQQVADIERQAVRPRDWAMPGKTLQGAMLDLARTICRRAERRVCALKDAGQLNNPEIIAYLNRLSDLLWLLARWAEARTSRSRRGKLQRSKKPP